MKTRNTYKSFAWAVLTLFLAFSLVVDTALTDDDTTGKLWLGFIPFLTLDFKQVFTEPGKWKDARSFTSVVKIYDLALLPGWCESVSNIYDRCILSYLNDEELTNAMSELRAWGIDFALEAGSVKEWSCGKDDSFIVTRNVIQRISANGGKVKYIAMDEPLISGLGPAPNGCSYDMSKTLDETILYINRIKTLYPDIVIGDIEPWPHFSKEQLKQWIMTFEEKAGYELPFFHLDVDYEAARGGAANLQDIQELSDFCYSRGIKFGVIIWQANFSLPLDSDKKFYDNSMAWAAVVHSTLNRQLDEAIIESWDRKPDYNLPDSNGWSLTQLARDYAYKYPPAIIPLVVFYISKVGVCSGKTPCYTTIQNGIIAATAPTAIKITQDIYDENIILNSNQVISLQGGWDLNFTSNPSYTTIHGSITITNGTMIFENIILK